VALHLHCVVLCCVVLTVTSSGNARQHHLVFKVSVSCRRSTVSRVLPLRGRVLFYVPYQLRAGDCVSCCPCCTARAAYGRMCIPGMHALGVGTLPLPAAGEPL
jgi:hypothetical protein